MTGRATRTHVAPCYSTDLQKRAPNHNGNFSVGLVFTKRTCASVIPATLEMNTSRATSPIT